MKIRHLIHWDALEIIIEFDNILWNKLHPTEKPVELMKRLIYNSSKEWELVLDPFAWSGTTWIACKELNREYILIEKDEKYIDVIQKRFNVNNLFNE